MKHADETTQPHKNLPKSQTAEKNDQQDKSVSKEVDNADPLLSQLDSTEFEKKRLGRQCMTQWQNYGRMFLRRISKKNG